MNMRVRSAWKESLIKLLSRGVSLTEAASRCRVGLAVVNQERRRDPEFRKSYEAARGTTNDQED